MVDDKTCHKDYDAEFKRGEYLYPCCSQILFQEKKKTFREELFYRWLFHSSGWESMGYLQQQEIMETG